MKTLETMIAEVWPGWRLESRIGAGAFGEVYRACREDAAGKNFAAIKVIRLSARDLRSTCSSEEEARAALDQMMSRVSREISVMKALQGQSHLVSIHDYRILEEGADDRTVLIQMELLTPLLVDLDIRSYDEDRLIRLGIDLCRGLEVCGRERIVHRDIKPENIFVNAQGDYKLGDFSVARTLDTVREKVTEWDFVRGQRFVAPELKNGLLREMSFEEAGRTDVYSLGMVMYWIANGQRMPNLPARPLLSSEEREEAERKRLRGEPLPDLLSVSKELQEILQKACAFQNADRYPDAAAFRQALEQLRTAKGTDRAAEKTSPAFSSGEHEKKRFLPGRGLRILACALIVLLAAAALWLGIPKRIPVRYVSEDGTFLSEDTLLLRPGSSINLLPDTIPEGYVPQGASVIPVSVDYLRRTLPAAVEFRCREGRMGTMPDTLRLNEVLYPFSYAMGLPFSFLGSVSSDVPLTEVTLRLYAAGETYTQQAELEEGACVYELRNLGDQMLKKLPEGPFYIELLAADSAGRHIGFSHHARASRTFPDHDIYDVTRYYMEPEKKGVIDHAGHTYEVYYQSGGGWDQASAFAQGKGGHLATLSEEREFDIVTSFCLGMGLKYLNIGLQLENGVWQWVDETPLYFCPWKPGVQEDGQILYSPVGCIVKTDRWYFSKATQFEMNYFIVEYDFGEY